MTLLVRSLALVAAAALAAVSLTGCGGGGSEVDSGGFTAADWKAAQDMLSTLARTSLWDTAAQVTYTNGAPTTACGIHIVKSKPRTFKVFMAWIPGGGGINRRYAWLQAVVGPELLKQDYSFRLRYTLTERALRSHYGDTFTKPYARCLVLENGRFALLPADSERPT